MEFLKQNITETISVFAFETEAAAIVAINTINAGEGIPADEQASTQTYTKPFAHNGTWYIKKDSVTEKYLIGGGTIEIPL
ncbi:hypothetical protein CAP35_13675 [Chitinophagaceae bacterium IBVUCB1]|nr:hypothetical protein CAP35_13675 [Chitinophagaceae bacterium IBVUCB1]